MNTKRRLARLESEITQELIEAENSKRQRQREWCIGMHLPLPPTATQSELDEALQRLLALQAKARSGSATDADLVDWHRWVDSIHERHNHRPPT